MITNNPSISTNRNTVIYRDTARTDSAPKNAVNTQSVSTSALSYRSSFADVAQSRESVLTRKPANSSIADSQVQEEFQQQFANLASDKKAFHGVLQDAFGENYDAQAGEAIRRQTLSGVFSWMPTIEFVDSTVLGDGVGAYDSENDRVLLNNDFKDSNLLSRVFTEEVGHALDARLNTADTAGDEGELFQNLVAGEAPTMAERQRMLNDDDHGTVMVDGKSVEVEFFFNPIKWIKNEIVEPVVNNVIKPVVNTVVKPVTNFFDGSANKLVNQYIVKPIRDRIIDPVVDFGGSVVSIAKDLFRFPFELGQTILEGGREFSHALAQGDLSAAGNAILKTIKQVGADSLNQIADTGVMGLHAVVNLTESVLGAVEERPLSLAEIAYLRPIYGDAINYSEVTIQSSGIKELLGSLGLRAHVVGNDIFLPDNLFYSDGSGLTDYGLKTLGHEMGHVWQFQNRGPDYISGALVAQFSDGSGGVGTGEGYDWLAFADEGIRFNDMNEESQAELASFIGQSIDRGTGRVDVNRLNKVIAVALGIRPPDTYAVSTQTLAIVNEAHDILLAGG